MWKLTVAGCALALLAVACDQSVDDGGDPDATSADASPAGDGAYELGLLPDAAPARTVNVTYNAQDKLIDLAEPTPVTFEGHPSARLSDVVSLAFPAATQADLTADFTAGDGFKPGSKSNCSGLVPVDGADFPKGYVDVATRKVRWELSLAFPGCLYIQDLAEILLADK